MFTSRNSKKYICCIRLKPFFILLFLGARNNQIDKGNSLISLVQIALIKNLYLALNLIILSKIQHFPTNTTICHCYNTKIKADTLYSFGYCYNLLNFSYYNAIINLKLSKINFKGL